MKTYDCFLFNDELELLEIRLELLSRLVDIFVIVQASVTFTNKASPLSYPVGSQLDQRYSHRIRLITLDRLEGRNAWDRETFQRNAISQGLLDVDDDDIIIISDIDEIPDPVLLESLLKQPPDKPVTIYLDYFNFKFNYKLIHGLQTLWAGPVLTPAKRFTSAQELRNIRWHGLASGDEVLIRGGWHFSFLTKTTEVFRKLNSFSHQERSIQDRKNSIPELIASRQGFHDHLHPGAVWGVISLNNLGSEPLHKLVLNFPELISQEQIDEDDILAMRIKRSVHRMVYREREKLLSFCSFKHLLTEMVFRLKERVLRII